MYIPPDANAKLAMNELSSAVSKLQRAHSDVAFFIIAGDFNHANLSTALPKFYQYVFCPTRGDGTLDHIQTSPIESILTNCITV